MKKSHDVKQKLRQLMEDNKVTLEGTGRSSPDVLSGIFLVGIYNTLMAILETIEDTPTQKEEKK